MAAIIGGQVAVVTGGGRGFGEQIAMRLAAEGAAVTVVARTSSELETVADRIRSMGGKALAIAADVTDRNSVDSAVATARKQFGAATILVNCAGIDRPFGPVGVIDPTEWWNTRAVHVLGPLLFMSAVIPGVVQSAAALATSRHAGASRSRLTCPRTASARPRRSV